MPFRKVENCNQVVKIGKELKFSLVNVAGNDIVQGNKKLILGNHYPRAHISVFLFRLMQEDARLTNWRYGFLYLRSLMAVDEIPYAPTSQESQISDTG